MTNMKTEQKIPEGWIVKRLKDVADVITGSTPPTSDLTNYGTEYLFVSPVDIKDNVKFINNTVTKLSFKGYSLGRAVSAGSPLFVCIGSTIGKIAIAGQTLTTNQQINSCIVNNQNNNEFLYYVLLFNANKIRQLAGEQAVPIINKSTFEKISFIVPPLPEQEKIAGILSCWDDGIEKLSALIEKKKIQKKALMQQLLTGKHRLKGFSTPWHEVRLSDIAIIATGMSKAQYINESGDYFVIDMGAVSNEATLIAKKRTSYDEDFLNVNDIIMPKDDIGGGNIIGKCIIVSENRKYILGDHVFKIVIKNNFPLFICLKINSFEINKYMKRCATGSAQLGLSKKDVSKCLLFIPSDLAEQKAIAEILSKADEEIELLNKKLEAFKQEKKALMQQLLTGKIRVKVN